VAFVFVKTGHLRKIIVLQCGFQALHCSVSSNIIVLIPNGSWRNETEPHIKSGGLRGSVVNLAVLVFQSEFRPLVLVFSPNFVFELKK
jgi:hypothetical protein